MKPWQRIVGLRPKAAGWFSRGADSRAAFDNLRGSMAQELAREPGSPLLVRGSLEALFGAFVALAQHRRGVIGLVAFELEDWKTVQERAGASVFESAFADLGRELRRCVRASDEIGRLGEAQLAAILPGCEQEVLGSVSERLCRSLEACELSLGPQPTRLAFAAASLSTASHPAGTSAARLLEELLGSLESARGGGLG